MSLVASFTDEAAQHPVLELKRRSRMGAGALAFDVTALERSLDIILCGLAKAGDELIGHSGRAIAYGRCPAFSEAPPRARGHVRASLQAPWFLLRSERLVPLSLSHAAMKQRRLFLGYPHGLPGRE
jgi:hypothetical protein